MRNLPLLMILSAVTAAACSGSGSDSMGNSLGAGDSGEPTADAGNGSEEPGPDATSGETYAGELGGDAGALDTDAGDTDAGATDAGELSVADAAAITCDLGTAQNGATAGTLSVFGDIAYFADGTSLRAGRYRITYLDGCMKYGGGQGWTIHAYPLPQAQQYGWWVVDYEKVQIALTPGTMGYDVPTGAFETFDECVTANLRDAPVEFEFAGGPLGVALFDTPYDDNMVGLDGRNPSFRLEWLRPCPD